MPADVAAADISSPPPPRHYHYAYYHYRHADAIIELATFSILPLRHMPLLLRYRLITAATSCAMRCYYHATR